MNFKSTNNGYTKLKLRISVNVIRNRLVNLYCKGGEIKQFIVVFDKVGDCPVWIEGGCNHPRTKNGHCYSISSDIVPPYCPCKDSLPDILESSADSSALPVQQL